MLIIFAEILHAGRAAIDMKHIKGDFSLKAWVPSLLGGLRGWGRGQNLTFSEYGHVAYQIKADNAGSNMVANILPADTPSTQGLGSKGQTISFSESSCVAYQIKADDAGSNMVANILPTDTPLTQAVGSKGQTISFSESSHNAYQIKADDAGSNMVANILPTDTPSTQGVGSKGQTINLFLKVVMLHIKLKGIEHRAP